MAKSKKKKSRQANRSAASPAMQQKKGHLSLSRRNVIKGAVLLGCVTSAGAAIHIFDKNSKELHDLSAIGAGAPVVVQVHDPSCPTCRKLKSATEHALKKLPEITYRIADLTTPKGKAIGQKYNVGKVTLLLFDARGKHVDTIQGLTPTDELRDTFIRRFKLNAPA